MYVFCIAVKKHCILLESHDVYFERIKLRDEVSFNDFRVIRTFDWKVD